MSSSLNDFSIADEILNCVRVSALGEGLLFMLHFSVIVIGAFVSNQIN